ncbi:MAG: cbb3-type cytochrome c oxidase subunit I [Planctomycetota bacterium]|jgi:nitric oxide reductase subunit B
MTEIPGDAAIAEADVDECGCPGDVDPSRRYATLTFMRASVVALAIALLSGLLGILYYIPAVAVVMQRLGLHFTALRPVHTTFAAVFIFLGGVAVVHRYLEDVAGPMGRGERLRLRIQVLLWAVAGIGVLVSLLAGVFSGREYMGFHPALSIPILLGWLLFTWNFLAHLGRGLFARPVHVTMWAVGLFLFIYTFVEQHGWLLPGVFSDPLVDIRVQWKATGSLVGSFNLFVYGSLYYLACKLSGDESYAHSHLAYALFGVGLLNSFTNFGHHTYHLPQNDAVKWISFVISMTEIVLLARVVWDIAAMVKVRRPASTNAATNATQLFVSAAKWWTAYILATSIIISVPPLNALIHGTPVVMAHGMGAEIGIDGMVLFAAFCWMLAEIVARRGGETAALDSPHFRRWIVGLNLGVAALIGWLTLSGTIIGVRRYNDLAPPEWLDVSSHFVLAACGVVTAWFLANLIQTWLRLLFPMRTFQSEVARVTEEAERTRASVG